MTTAIIHASNKIKGGIFVYCATLSHRQKQLFFILPRASTLNHRTRPIAAEGIVQNVTHTIIDNIVDNFD